MSESAEVLELRHEIERLRAALAKAREHVWATSQAEHMMDGFGPRSHQPSDDLLAEIDALKASETA